MNNKDIHFVFFGTPDLAVTILEELKKENLVPSLVITAPDRRKGRGMKLTSPPVKQWSDAHKIPTLQPEKLLAENIPQTLRDAAPKGGWDVFVVAAYGKILPPEILLIPKKGILNVHPSLLPKYRGPSPIEAQILNDERKAGVSIMLLDEEMDHGPVLAQTQVELEETPNGAELEDILAHEGGALLGYTLPLWVSDHVEVHKQDHEKATYCPLIKKEDAEISLSGNSRENFLKIKAYDRSPKAFFFADRNGKRIRVKVAGVEYHDGTLAITRVIPEGKKEMAYRDFLGLQ